MRDSASARKTGTASILKTVTVFDVGPTRNGSTVTQEAVGVMPEDSKSLFWANILAALETKQENVSQLRGASGFSHPLVSLGIDEQRRRLVVVSAESDARNTALVQSDLQAAIKDVHVIVARPATVNLAPIAKAIVAVVGKLKLTDLDLKKLTDSETQHVKDEVKQRMEAAFEEEGVGNLFAHAPRQAAELGVIPIIREFLHQAALLDFREIEAEEKKRPSFNMDITRLAAFDAIEADQRVGICSIPLYEFQVDDVERLRVKLEPDFARALLQQQNVLQYFFPPADHLALGLVERAQGTVSDLVRRLEAAPENGHPFGRPEILEGNLPVPQVIDYLLARGLLVEGDVDLRVTPSGKELRASVRFRPREGLITRLASLLSVKIDLSLKDLRDLFRGFS